MTLQFNFLFSIVLMLCAIQMVDSAEIGGKVHSCSLTSMNQEHRYDLQQFEGKVVYVDFWASWCPPCLKSFPFMNELQHDLKDQGLQIIAINLDEAPEDAENFLTNFPAEFMIASDPDKQCARNFNVQAMPSSYLIDRKGIIHHVHLGFRAGEAQEIRKLAEQLLAISSAAN